MNQELLPILTGDVLDEAIELTLSELCQVCRVPEEQVYELVAEGVVEPLNGEASHWRFQASCVRRVHSAVQLHQDLGINWAGAALALDLLDELEVLRARIRRLEE